MSPALPARWLDGWRKHGVVTAAMVGAWVLVYGKVGVGRVLGWEVVIAQIERLPRAIDRGAAHNYVNYSVLPAIASKLFHATSAQANTGLQVGLMVVGVAVVVLARARRDVVGALMLVAGFFSTWAPLAAARLAGGYDNVLIVLLLATASVEGPVACVLLGVGLGATHAELGLVAIVQLAALSWAGIGTPGLRRWVHMVAGVLGVRVCIMIWVGVQGASGDRLAFLQAEGVQKIIADTGQHWLLILWSAAAGGWFFLVFVGVKNRRAAIVLAGALLVDIVLVLVTVDKTRVAALLGMPLVCMCARHSWTEDSTPRPRRTALSVAAVALTAATPWIAVYYAETFHLSTPFTANW